MVDLSIVVPVYNTYKYLDKCLHSLCKQLCSSCKFEIIVINDGSTDKSEDIILSYAKKYPKIIRHFKKKNSGISSTRNFGIEHCKGEYIMFVDSDDFVETNLISDFVNKNKNYDLFIHGYYEVFEKSNKRICYKIENDKIIDNVCSLQEALSLIVENRAVRGYLWNKVLKKSIIVDNHLKFDEKIKYIEDLPFVISYLKYCKTIYISSSTSYNYMQRMGSLVNSGFNEGKLSSLIGYKYIENEIMAINPVYIKTFYYYIFELNYELSVRIRKSSDFLKYKNEYFNLKKNMNKYYKLFIFKRIKIKYKIKATIKLVFYNLILMRYKI